jgi:hypothetical protein
MGTVAWAIIRKGCSVGGFVGSRVSPPQVFFNPVKDRKYQAVDQ